MKIEAYQNEPTLVIGGGKEMKFSIEENGVIFDILRDKMYSNKIGSIVREVASNSRDANRENGNADIPVTIMITKQYSQTLQDQHCIVFRDSGLGISPDRMANVFVKYAASTKRGTDAQTGGFGLGAKTPFAYTDSFYIHTTADYAEPITEIVEEEFPDGTVVEKEHIIGYEPISRKSYFYNALIDDSGTGKMILLEEELSTEPTGTDIILPLVDSGDKYKFANETIFYTSLWGSGIKLEGVSEYSSNYLKEEDIILDDELLTIVEYSYYTPYEKGVYCLVDGIPYPIDTRISERITDLNNKLDSHTIFLKFNTGEISVTATREGVEYNDKTKKAIDLAFGKLLRVMLKRFSKLVNSMSYGEVVAGVVSTFAKQQNLFQRSLFQDTLEGKVIIIINKYVESIDVLNEVSYKGQTLQSLLNLYGDGQGLGVKKEFEIVKVEKREPEKYKIMERSNILKLMRSPVYLMDSNKDRRRNHTIFDNMEHEHFYLIRPYGRRIEEPLSNTQCSMFMDMAFKFEIDLNFYSEVEKKVFDPGITMPGIYIPGETVQTRWRQVSTHNRSEGGSSFVVDVNRKDFTYTEFKSAKHYVFTVEKLSDFSCDASFMQLAADAGYNVYITTKKVQQMYFPSETFLDISEQRKLVGKMRELKLEALCEGLDIDMLKTSIGARKNLKISTGERYSIYYNSEYGSRISLMNLMILGIYSDRVRILCKLILKADPTIELVKFMLENHSKIEELSNYDEQIKVFTRRSIGYTKKSLINEKVRTILQKTFGESIILERTLGNTDNITSEQVDKLVEELLILKSI